ncbi:MAG: hypothetical protein ACLQAT_14150 [Candidatus Binataceae bacterium]
MRRSSDDASGLPRNDWWAGIAYESGGETFVAMMQATYFWYGDDSSEVALVNTGVKLHQ